MTSIKQSKKFGEHLKFFVDKGNDLSWASQFERPWTEEAAEDKSDPVGTNGLDQVAAYADDNLKCVHSRPAQGSLSMQHQQFREGAQFCRREGSNHPERMDLRNLKESGFFDRSGLSVGHAAMETPGETISPVKFPERVATVELGTAQSNKEGAEIQNPEEQVALLKESAAKKDSELSSPRTQEERYERGTSGDCRIVYTREHFQKTRPSTRKFPSKPKYPVCLGSSHSSEDTIAQLVSSSMCSPPSSLSEQLDLFDILEEGVSNVIEKVRVLKNQRNGTGTSEGSWTSEIHTTFETKKRKLKTKDLSKLKTKDLSMQREPTTRNHVKANLLELEEEVALKELQHRSLCGVEGSGNFSQKVEMTEPAEIRSERSANGKETEAYT